MGSRASIAIAGAGGKLVLLLACAACGRPAPAPVPAAPTATDARGLAITLVWSAPVDLDLYVTTPAGETLYYANPGRAFEVDARCADGATGGRIERARWRTPAPGRYRVGVDFPEACSDALPDAPYRLVVDLDGRREEHAGRVHLRVREPAVLEVTVR